MLKKEQGPVRRRGPCSKKNKAPSEDGAHAQKRTRPRPKTGPCLNEQSSTRFATRYRAATWPSRRKTRRGCADYPVQIALRQSEVETPGNPGLHPTARPGLRRSLRKEVIQPQVPLRLPCYDLVPVTSLAVGTTESWRLRALPASMT